MTAMTAIHRLSIDPIRPPCRSAIWAGRVQPSQAADCAGDRRAPREEHIGCAASWERAGPSALGSAERYRTCPRVARHLAGCLVLGALALATALHAGEVYKVLPDQSKIGFAGTSTLHDFTGTAKAGDGVFRLVPGNASGFIQVGTASMSTAHAERDARMHKETVESAKHAQIRFDLAACERTPAGFTVTGAWAMHGVSKDLVIPVALVAPKAAGEPAHLTATFKIDIRDWKITPPRTALVITVDPIITITVDLALAEATAADLPQTAAPKDFAGLTFTDHLGGAHDLGKESAGRLLILFDLDNRVDAKQWDQLISQHLPAERELVRVLDGSRYAEADRPRVIEKIAKALDGTGVKFLLDWTGAARKRADAPTDRNLIVACDATGRIIGRVDGDPTGANQTAALRLIGITPKEPIPDPSGGGKPGKR